jgi:glyoxylase-like metal-dependent hydrolase (beta-lactamase superfamily II)
MQHGFIEGVPRVYKFVNEKLETDRNRIMEHPEILDHLFNTREGDTFTIVNREGEAPAVLTCIETPGHIDDHLCFLL